MPNTPVALRVPSACELCGRAGFILLQQNIQGECVTLHWHCKACGQEWPVRRREEVAPVV